MRLLILLILFFAVAEARHCTFIPPAGWEIAQLKSPSPNVNIGLIGKASTDFRPSINLATEEVDVSLKEYVKAVKALQTADPTTKWRDLGKLPMQGGTGHLIEMSNKSPWGEIKILQAFFIADQTAYILTAAVMKEDFPKFQAELLQSLKSLTLISDLSSPIADPTQREAFQTLFASLEKSADKDQKWEQLQAQVQANPQPGPYWQFLALQEGRAKIDSAKEAK